MKKNVLAKITSAINTLGFDKVDFSISEPPADVVADWASNVALIIAGKSKSNPREIAEKIKLALEQDADVAKIEIAGPGFINITLKPEIYLAELAKIVLQKDNYGKSIVAQSRKVNVEYVSANPTGPLHVGNARGGPIGESLANLFTFIGHKVQREFYVNDIGGQAMKFGRTLNYWYALKSDPKTVFPEDGYPGDHLREISESVVKKYEDEIGSLSEEARIDFFREHGIEIVVEGIKADLKLLGIEFDLWYFQSQIIAEKKSEKVIEVLKEKGMTYEKDDALWFSGSSNEDPDDKDNVLVKNDGETMTYFADDIAYHKEKFERGNDLLINIWGANHSGHIPRMKAAMEAIGYKADQLEIVLYQYVRLKKSGQAVSMGKRLGNFVTLREVIEAGVEADAFKYFILAQNPNTPIDFDIELAADRSEKNPVYYIKYAHARICSILEKAPFDSTQGGTGDPFDSAQSSRVDYSCLKDSKELALIKELVKFPDIIEEISQNFQIQTLPHFAYKIAGLFHDFYSTCRVIGAETKELEAARLSLVLATKYILKNSLEILGIEAPEKM